VFCNIAGGEPGIFLDDFCGISYGSHIFSQSDDYSGIALTGPTVPLPYRREQKAAVSIGRHVIVGAGSIVMPGVTVSEGGSIGAMSLVTKTTLPWSIYVGAPARRIGERKKDMLKLEALYLKESE
jgi:galactoside O-acetyltransferase